MKQKPRIYYTETGCHSSVPLLQLFRASLKQKFLVSKFRGHHFITAGICPLFAGLTQAALSHNRSSVKVHRVMVFINPFKRCCLGDAAG